MRSKRQDKTCKRCWSRSCRLANVTVPHGTIQSLSRRFGTAVKSAVLCVTKVRLRCKAVAASNASMSGIGVPKSINVPRSFPYSNAIARSISMMSIDSMKSMTVCLALSRALPRCTQVQSSPAVMTEMADPLAYCENLPRTFRSPLRNAEQIFVSIRKFKNFTFSD